MSQQSKQALSAIPPPFLSSRMHWKWELTTLTDSLPAYLDNSKHSGRWNQNSGILLFDHPYRWDFSSFQHLFEKRPFHDFSYALPVANASDLIFGFPSFPWPSALKEPKLRRRAVCILSYSNDVVAFKTIFVPLFQVCTFQQLASSYIFGELHAVQRRIFASFLELSNELKHRFLCSPVILKVFVGFICEIMLLFLKTFVHLFQKFVDNVFRVKDRGIKESATAAPCLIFGSSVTCCHNATSRLHVSYVFSLESGGTCTTSLASCYHCYFPPTNGGGKS